MTSPNASSPASAFVITPTLQPVTVTLTHELLYDLRDVAIKAVARNDLPSLAALKTAGVDLDSALTYSVRNGHHATTRGLREMGVNVTAIIVDWAVAKRPGVVFQSLRRQRARVPQCGTQQGSSISLSRSSISMECRSPTG